MIQGVGVRPYEDSNPLKVDYFTNRIQKAGSRGMHNGDSVVPVATQNLPVRLSSRIKLLNLQKLSLGTYRRL